jgi:predicted ribosome quality control (RQC) complex YloA/Tae2 family protein
MSTNVKHKQKLTTLDVTAEVASLRAKLVGKRLSNIYDLDKKNYLFKIGGGEDKEVLHVNVGIHFNTTLKEYDKKMIPSGFTMKLRKNLKSKRVESIEQLGVERVVRIQFGSGEATYYLFLEFYSKVDKL